MHKPPNLKRPVLPASASAQFRLCKRKGTLLSIIPILAILFAIARGFGFSNLLETQFRSGLEGQSAAAETILGLIDSYLVHAKSGIFIGVGLVMLFWTILSLTYNIERTFNYIWQDRKSVV